VWDDRTDVSAGEHLADADLIGAALRVTLGTSTTTQHTVEITERRTGLVHTVSADSVVEQICQIRHRLLEENAVDVN
jgi:prolyl-tRNA synthetase